MNTRPIYINIPLSDNSKNHLLPSSLCGPEATFFMTLVTDLVPVNVAYLDSDEKIEYNNELEMF